MMSYDNIIPNRKREGRRQASNLGSKQKKRKPTTMRKARCCSVVSILAVHAGLFVTASCGLWRTQLEARRQQQTPRAGLALAFSFVTTKNRRSCHHSLPGVFGTRISLRVSNGSTDNANRMGNFTINGSKRKGETGTKEDRAAHPPSGGNAGPKGDGIRRRLTRRTARTQDRRQREMLSTSSSSSVGPKPSRGPRATPVGRRQRTRNIVAADTASVPTAATVVASNGASSGSDHKSPPLAFDAESLVAEQTYNMEAPRLDLRATLSSSGSLGLRCVTTGISCSTENRNATATPVLSENPNPSANINPNENGTTAPLFEYRSLDDLLSAAGLTETDAMSENLGGNSFSLSQKFNADEAFRTDLRSAIRLDIFETTPFYAKLPEKAKAVLLLPDSSLEGSWRIPDCSASDSKEEGRDLPPAAAPRMKHTTRVLNAALEEHYRKNEEHGASPHQSCRPWLTGDDLVRAIGSICGPSASTHWIDIHGVQNKKINHSWHLDAGVSPGNRRTVLWGFPPTSGYEGTGVFSHLVPLAEPFDELVAPTGSGGTTPAAAATTMDPVLFEGTVDERHVVRPVYAPGKELLVYRDVDVLHSAPDVAYRTSVMRFM